MSAPSEKAYIVLVSITTVSVAIIATCPGEVKLALRRPCQTVHEDSLFPADVVVDVLAAGFSHGSAFCAQHGANVRQATITWTMARHKDILDSVPYIERYLCQVALRHLSTGALVHAYTAIKSAVRAMEAALVLVPALAIATLHSWQFVSYFCIHDLEACGCMADIRFFLAYIPVYALPLILIWLVLRSIYKLIRTNG